MVRPLASDDTRARAGGDTGAGSCCPGEDPDSFDEERTWELLAPWFGPGDGRLLRHVVYEFRSLLAERMREGRVLLAGDSAHLTPPFLGQGLGAGLRDAVNLAWKLDLVLRDEAPPSLLDTVTAERQPQNEWVISFAIELGRALCELDPVKASSGTPRSAAAGLLRSSGLLRSPPAVCTGRQTAPRIRWPAGSPFSRAWR